MNKKQKKIQQDFKILNLSTRLSQGYFENLLPASKGLKGVPNFFYHLIFVSKPYIPNLRPLRQFLHVEKFVVVVVVVVVGGC